MSTEAPSRRRAATWLLLLAVPVWAVGLYYSMVERSKQSKPRGAHRWHARYAKLGPLLEGERRVTIVYNPEDPRRDNKRLFQAQYVLAPKVVVLLGRTPPRIRPWKAPLIYDFRRPKPLAAVLAETAAEARDQGIAFDARPVAKSLALVTMRPMPTAEGE